jgi:hypothetical protein
MDKKKFALIIKDRLSPRETEEGAAKMMGSSNGQKNITVDAQDASFLRFLFLSPAMVGKLETSSSADLSVRRRSSGVSGSVSLSSRSVQFFFIKRPCRLSSPEPTPFVRRHPSLTLVSYARQIKSVRITQLSKLNTMMRLRLETNDFADIRYCF